MMPNRKVCEDAVRWWYGVSKAEAKKKIDTLPEKAIQEIVYAFLNNARKAFYFD